VAAEVGHPSTHHCCKQFIDAHYRKGEALPGFSLFHFPSGRTSAVPFSRTGIGAQPYFCPHQNNIFS
jgi:hypothetical protein